MVNPPVCFQSGTFTTESCPRAGAGFGARVQNKVLPAGRAACRGPPVGRQRRLSPWKGWPARPPRLCRPAARGVCQMNGSNCHVRQFHEVCLAHSEMSFLVVDRTGPARPSEGRPAHCEPYPWGA